MLKDVPPEGDTYNGKFIPGGTAIGYSVVGMLMDKKKFGEDAATFRPERFLEGTEDELQSRNAIFEAAFGYGRWRCLGMNIAQLELNKATTELGRLRKAYVAECDLCQLSGPNSSPDHPHL